MIFRYHLSRRGRSDSNNLSRLPIIIIALLAASLSSLRLTAFSFRIVHPLSSSAAAAALSVGLFGTTSTRHNRSSPSASLPSRLTIASRAVVSSSKGENTDSMASPPPTLESTVAIDASIPGISSRTLHNLVEYATSFSAANGLQVELRDSTLRGGYITAPISLLPQCYPASQFRRATLLAAPFNILVDRISNDGEFLKKTLRDVRDVDLYTGKLLELYEEIYLGERKGMEWGKHARYADKLGIQRSDYMLHKETSTVLATGTTGATESGEATVAAAAGGEYYSLKQVELNTIASSFAGLASTVARMHSFLTQRLEGELERFLGENERAVMGMDVDGSNHAILGESSSSSSFGDDCMNGIAERGVPESLAMSRIPSAIAVAFDRYCTRFETDASDATTSTTTQPTVLFVVQPKETNTVDQRLLEFALWSNHKIPVVRMSLAEVYERVTLDEESGRLTFDDGTDYGGSNSKREVAVVYFRAGYAPSDYPSGYNTKDGTGVEWLARERLERGVATKCPSLGYHMAGTKKVQQELARPGVVEHFFPENDGDNVAAVRLIRTAFAGLFSLGADANEEDMKAVKEVLLHDGEGRYVLKPQREGGGYNFYGKQLAEKLRSYCTITNGVNNDAVPSIQLSTALSEFILMERLFPPQQRAILLRNGRVEGSGMTISELGCFGTIVVSGEGDVVHNEYAGFLLRTKFSGVDEGGVASGFATLSSPYLC